MPCRRRPGRAARGRGGGRRRPRQGTPGGPRGPGHGRRPSRPGAWRARRRSPARWPRPRPAAAFRACLACLLFRSAAGCPLPPGGLACPVPRLAGPGFGPAGRVTALFLQLRRGQDLARGGQLGRVPAQQVIGQVMIDQAGDPPDRLLRRGDADPGPLVPRAAQRLEHPLRGRLAAHSPAAVNESHPASLAAIEIAITHGRVNRTPRGSRGSGSRPSHRHSEAGAAGSGEST